MTRRWQTGSARAIGLAVVGLCLAAAACQRPSVGERSAGPVVASGPTVVVDDAWLDLHGRVVATFTVREGDAPLALDEVTGLAPRFTLAILADHPVDGLRAWKSLLLTGCDVAAALPLTPPGAVEPEILTSVRQPGFDRRVEPAEAKEACLEASPSLVGLGAGRYRYVFTNAVDGGVAPDDVLRVGVWLDAAPAPSADTSSTLDFRPSGRRVEPGDVREVVLDENCAGCHGTLVHHRRSGVRLCATCHTWQNVDPHTFDPAAMTTVANPNPLDLGRLIHRIHRGKDLPTLYQSSSTLVDPDPLNTTGTLPLPFSPENNTTALVGKKFLVVGERSERSVFAEVVQRMTLDGSTTRTVARGVVFPRDLRDCDACHANARDAAEAASAISRRTCSGCHPDVWFGDTGPTDGAHRAHGGGPQAANDAACRGCHVEPAAIVPISGPSSAHAPFAKSARYDIPEIEIVSITGLVPGSAPVVKFKLRDRTGFIGPKPSLPKRKPSDPDTLPLKADPSGEAPSPVATVSRALSSLTIRITGPGAVSGPRSSDYTSFGFPLASSGLTSLSDSAAVDPTYVYAFDPDYVRTFEPEYVYTFATAIPTTATGTWMVAMEARRNDGSTDTKVTKVPQYTKNGTTGKPETFNWPYTGETVNETAENPIAWVDTRTGTWPPDGPDPRRQIVAQDKCLRCHGRIEFHQGGARHEVALCLMCHTPDKTDYGGRTKLDGFVNLGATYDGVEERSLHLKVLIHRIHTGGREGAASLEGISPFALGRGSFFEGLFPNDLRNCTACHEGKSYLVDAIPKDAVATIANETATILHAASASAHSEGEPETPPIQAACTSCHATGATFAHVEAKTVGGVETCASCHSSGALSVEVAHGLAPAGGGAAGSTFSSIVQAVLVPRCATSGCHASGASSPVLEASVAYGNLVNAPSVRGGTLVQVEPGVPAESYLVQRVRSDMPPGAPLDPADVAAIEAWIANGAPND